MRRLSVEGKQGGVERYADALSVGPKVSIRQMLRIGMASAAALFALGMVVALVDRAWLDRAGDLQPPERFAIRLPLLAIVLPAALATLAAVGIGATLALRRSPTIVRVMAVPVTLALVSAA